jgi:hypothetical protein
MRNAFPTFFLLCSLLPALAWAQAQAETPAKTNSAESSGSTQPQNMPPAPSRPDSKIENIQHEDSGSRIDELRVGGVTQTITVQPKGGNLPPYDLSPENSRQSGSSGKRGWTVLGF